MCLFSPKYLYDHTTNVTFKTDSRKETGRGEGSWGGGGQRDRKKNDRQANTQVDHRHKLIRKGDGEARRQEKEKTDKQQTHIEREDRDKERHRPVEVKSGMGSPDWNVSMVDIHLRKLLWVHCPGHAGLKGADRLAGKQPSQVAFFSVDLKY